MADAYKVCLMKISFAIEKIVKLTQNKLNFRMMNLIKHLEAFNDISNFQKHIVIHHAMYMCRIYY